MPKISQIRIAYVNGHWIASNCIGLHCQLVANTLNLYKGYCGSRDSKNLSHLISIIVEIISLNCNLPEKHLLRNLCACIWYHHRIQTGQLPVDRNIRWILANCRKLLFTHVIVCLLWLHQKVLRISHTKSFHSSTSKPATSAAYMYLPSIELISHLLLSIPCSKSNSISISSGTLNVSNFNYYYYLANVNISQNVYLICNYLEQVMRRPCSKCQNTIRFIVIIRRLRLNVMLDLHL